MAGRFGGVSDVEWPLWADIFPPEPTLRGRGMPHTPFRAGVNTLLSVLISGCCRWGVPSGPQRASKSPAHPRLQRWQADGTRARMQARFFGIAEQRGLMRWQYGAVEGSFPLAKAAVKGAPPEAPAGHRDRERVWCQSPAPAAP
jgi:hypothetical protein